MQPGITGPIVQPPTAHSGLQQGPASRQGSRSRGAQEQGSHGPPSQGAGSAGKLHPHRPLSPGSGNPTSEAGRAHPNHLEGVRQAGGCLCPQQRSFSVTLEDACRPVCSGCAFKSREPSRGLVSGVPVTGVSQWKKHFRRCLSKGFSGIQRKGPLEPKFRVGIRGRG